MGNEVNTFFDPNTLGVRAFPDLFFAQGSSPGTKPTSYLLSIWLSKEPPQKCGVISLGVLGDTFPS